MALKFNITVAELNSRGIHAACSPEAVDSVFGGYFKLIEASGDVVVRIRTLLAFSCFILAEFRSNKVELGDNLNKFAQMAHSEFKGLGMDLQSSHKGDELPKALTNITNKDKALIDTWYAFLVKSGMIDADGMTKAEGQRAL